MDAESARPSSSIARAQICESAGVHGLASRACKTREHQNRFDECGANIRDGVCTKRVMSEKWTAPFAVQIYPKEPAHACRHLDISNMYRKHAPL